MPREGKRVMVVRFSLKDALEEVSEGGKIQPMVNGTAEVIDRRGYVRGYLTKADYAKHRREQSGDRH